MVSPNIFLQDYIADVVLQKHVTCFIFFKMEEITMKLEDLLKKNKAIYAQREQERKAKELESKRLEQEKQKKQAAKKASEKEEKLAEEKELEEVPAEEQPAEPKKVKKPAKRQYMVVEDVEKVND